ncbi:MAG TPA: hypothetical protein VGB84_09200 [Arachidicoccus sp.]
MAVSCSKDNYSGPAYEDPALEKTAIDSFIQAREYSMIEDPANQGLMYQVLSWGDTTHGRLTQDSAVAVIKFKTELLSGITIDSTASDATASINYAYSTVTSKPAIPTASQAFLVYLAQLGKGGSIRLVVPSMYVFGSQTRTLNGVTIPGNSPIYYEIQFIDRKLTTAF